MAKTALITGCSAGIGVGRSEFICGQKVECRGRRGVRQAAAQDLAAKANVLVAALDVTDEGSIDAAVKKAEERFGAIDVLVNNAGFGVYGLLESDPGGEHS